MTSNNWLHCVLQNFRKAFAETKLWLTRNNGQNNNAGQLSEEWVFFGMYKYEEGRMSTRNTFTVKLFTFLTGIVTVQKGCSVFQSEPTLIQWCDFSLLFSATSLYMRIMAFLAMLATLFSTVMLRRSQQVRFGVSCKSDLSTQKSKLHIIPVRCAKVISVTVGVLWFLSTIQVAFMYWGNVTYFGIAYNIALSTTVFPFYGASMMLHSSLFILGTTVSRRRLVSWSKEWNNASRCGFHKRSVHYRKRMTGLYLIIADLLKLQTFYMYIVGSCVAYILVGVPIAFHATIYGGQPGISRVVSRTTAIILLGLFGCLGWITRKLTSSTIGPAAILRKLLQTRIPLRFRFKIRNVLTLFEDGHLLFKPFNVFTLKTNNMIKALLEMANLFILLAMLKRA